MSDFANLFNQYKTQAGIAGDRGVCALLSKVLEQYKLEQQLTLLKTAIDKNLDINAFAVRLSARADVTDLKAFLEAKAKAAAPKDAPVVSLPASKPAPAPAGPAVVAEPNVEVLNAVPTPPSTSVLQVPASMDSASNTPPSPRLDRKKGPIMRPVSAGGGESPIVKTPGSTIVPVNSDGLQVVEEGDAQEGDAGADQDSAPTPPQLRKPRAPGGTVQTQLIDEDVAPASIKGWFVGRREAFNEWRERLGSNKGGTSSASKADKKPSAGNGAKIAFGVLAGLILIVVLGVLWRLGNENGEYSSSNNSSVASLGLSACTTTEGLPGVTRYNVTPNPDIVGLSGFTDPQRTLPYQNSALVFEQGKSYQAIIVGDNYRVGLGTDISVYAPVYSFTQTGSECVQEVAVQVLTSGIESQQRASVQLAYKIDFSHWSGWLVALSLASILGFTGISLFMSGGKVKDLIVMVVFVSGIAIFTKVSDAPPWAYFLIYIIGYIAAVNFGNKSELQEQKDSFEAGNQLRLPESMKSLFDSLSRGLGLVGGYDWTQSGVYNALMLAVGALFVSASPLVRALDSQMTAIIINALLLTFSFAMEAWRRGLPGDWVAFGFGFLGLIDFGIYYSAFGVNPPSILDFSPTALSVVGWAATFIVVAIVNFIVQAASERTELQRDRMSDGMLFYSSMKLVAVLSYVFLFLM